MKQGQKPAQEAQTARTPGPTRILALDYGRARIGLAVADLETRLPRPLGTLERINRNKDMRRLRELARDHGVKQIIVGLPLRLDGTRGEMAEEAERFAERLRKQLALPVELVDERLTSWEAERLMEGEFGRRVGALKEDSHTSHSQKRRPGHPPREGHSSATRTAESTLTVDAVAAAVILKEYLERKGGTDKGLGATRSA